jgi:predicted nucleic acid-binding protein
LKNNASEISVYAFKADDELLIDTNIWLFIYGLSKPSDARSATYSKALSEMLAASCRIYMDVLVLSEYINAYARFRHNLLKGSAGVDNVFKSFRKSTSFNAIAVDIAGDVRQIMKHCERIEGDFPSIGIDALIDEFEKGDSDFNDQVLADICRRRNLKLVTHDADFKDRGLDILTSNQNLLV